MATAVDSFGLEGTTLDGKYAVEHVVDQGGFATIYRAEHLYWRQKVAIKVFRFDEDEHCRLDLLEGFLQEGAILAQLSRQTPAVCQARDVGSARLPTGEWVPFTVLEWLEGCSLSALLKRESSEGTRPRSLGEAIAFLDPIAFALGLAHGQGITHRDLKPSNVFVLRDAPPSCPRVKLLDFAVAKMTDATRATIGPSPRARDTLNRLFTPAYAAPEQFNEHLGTTGPWTDVFALALLLVRVLTAKAPLTGPGTIGYVQHCLDPVVRPTPRTLGARVSDAVEHVFERALAVSPEDRFHDAAAFWSALRAASMRESMSEATTEVKQVKLPSGVRPVAKAYPSPAPRAPQASGTATPSA